MDRSLRQFGAIVLGSALIVAGGAALAADPGFISGSTGNDGAFNPPSNVPPGTSVTGSIYTVPLPASGIFNFSTITIPANTTVIFTKNAANTPAILLAIGEVKIEGTLDVSGGDGGALGRPGPGGPGGFDGGPGADGVTAIFAGGGLGPGGGNPGTGNNCGGSGASYGTAGVVGTNCSSPTPDAAPTYGSPALRPILGGSGGAGGGVCCLPGNPEGYGSGGAGGGGGGALIVASSGPITVTGQILADGGAGVHGNGLNVHGGGGGSGGAIRLIATSISSSGSLYARGKIGGYAGGKGGFGRIRLEAINLTVGGTRTPEATQGLPQSVFPAAGQPTLTITSVAGVTAPASPSGSFLTTPDILLPSGTTSPVQVVLTATNVPLGTTIAVTATPQSGAKTPPATSTGLAGTFVSSSATANLPVLLTQTSVLTATATFPLVAFSAGPGPLYAADEEVTHVRVAAVLGGPSTVTYLTRTGREVALP